MSLWSCSTCPKSFARKGDLTRHMLIHTGTRPHVCETCGKGFTQSSGLKTHRNVHSRAKPYKCGIGTCKKAFGDPSSCSRHRKETHRRKGAYKCLVTDCGTRIKRRSAFVAHLRRHGLDPDSIDLDAIIPQSDERGVPTLAHFASLDAESKSNNKTEPRSVPPSSLVDSSRYHTLDNRGEASHLMDNIINDRWSNDDLFGRRANWSLANDALLLPVGPTLDQTMNVGPSGHPADICAYPSDNLDNSFCFDGMSLEPVGYPLFCATSSHPLETFLEAGSEGSQSSWPSPSSTYSALYATNFNEDVLSLSLASNESQDSLLYNLI